MRVIHRPHASSPGKHACRPLLLLVLLGALGAGCGDEEREPGLLVFDRDAFDFGQVLVTRSSDEKVFTVRNAGPDPLTDLEVRLEAATTFEVLGTTCAGWLEPSETCTVTVAFTPVQAGTVEASLVVETRRAEAHVDLAGTGAVLVRVTNTASSSPVVVSEPAGIVCGLACEALFTVPEIVLSVPDGGLATWSGPCQSTDGGACRLLLTEETSVELLDFSTGVQWIFNGDSSITTLALDPENNVVATGGGSPFLFKLSPAGELLSQTDDFGPAREAAVDAQGGVALFSHPRTLWKLDAGANAQWGAELAQDVLTEIRAIAFDPLGDLYVTGTQGSDTAKVTALIKYNAIGGLAWSLTYAPSTINEVAALAVDPDGNVIIAGAGFPGPGEGGTSVQFLRKYDTNGNVLWTIEDLGISGYNLAVDSLGNIFVADRVTGSAPGSHEIHKYGRDGALLWDSGSDDVGGQVRGLAVTPAGDVIAIGTRVDDGSRAVGVWAAKFDGASGTRRRPIVIQLQGDNQYGQDVAVDRDGNVFLAGGQDEPWLRKYDAAVFDQAE